MDLKMYRLTDLDPDDPVHSEDIVRWTREAARYIEELEWDRKALEWLVSEFMCLDEDLRSPINEDLDQYRWLVRCNQTLGRESHSHDDWRDAIEEAMTCDKPFKYYGTGPANL